MADAGRGGGSRLRVSSTRRFMRCLVVERRATFLDTMTAYPLIFFGRIAVKFGDETRRPLLRADGNATRGSRFLRGNTRFYYGVRRVLPIRRRPRMILRPEDVLFLERNPCAFARLRFFG